MKKLLLLTALALLSCDNDKNYCLQTVKYQKDNGDYIITVNEKVDCKTCQPIKEREGLTFVECLN